MDSVREAIMRIIEIISQANGSHNNQTSTIDYIPEGYAQIPDDMPIPDTFPFVNIEVADEVRYTEKQVYNEETEETEIEKIPYTVKVVTSMTEGVVPPPEPIPEAEATTDEIINALLGVTEDE
jgi:hypothetical protein